MIPPLVFPHNRQADKEPTKLIPQADKPNFLPELALLSVSRSSVLFFTVGVGTASITSLATSFDSAVAQMPLGLDQKPLGERTISQVNVLFVNPSVGNDSQGNGGESTPLKTITQALRLATANTRIMLSTGTYSAESGEVFPLILRSGVSIQGDARNKGKGIIITGGGDYLSRSFGGQNVTIVGANLAGLSGVTITNPNPRGYGLWIESNNPIVTENTFTGSTQDGICVTGNAAPTIRQNYFERNGANGITIAGNSIPQVRENIFQQTGFGINIAQNAAPVIVGNQIQYNRSGIVVQANARPILRSNLIQGSKEDGLVAIAQAIPDLGTEAEPGGNQFQNNARYDINASAAKQLISAPGNTLDKNRLAGKVEVSTPTAAALIARNPLPLPASLRHPTSQELSATGEIVFSAPGVAQTANRPSTPAPSPRSFADNIPTSKPKNQPLPIQPTNSPAALPRQSTQPQTSLAADFPIPTGLADRTASVITAVSPKPQTTLTPNIPQLNYVQIDRNSLAQPPLPRQGQPEAAPLGNLAEKLSTVTNSPLTASVLPVPNSNIPLGNTRNIEKVALPQSYSPVSDRNFPSENSTPRIGVRYRVLVEVASERDQELVLYLAPAAFTTVSRGRNVMQVGVFSNQNNADGMMRTLTSNGLRAIIELLN